MVLCAPSPRVLFDETEVRRRPDAGVAAEHRGERRVTPAKGKVQAPTAIEFLKGFYPISITKF